MKYSSIVALHLDNYKTPVELSETLEDAGISGVKADEILELKEDGFDIIYLDVNTGNAIAYHVKGMHSSKVVPMQPFIEHMTKLECVSKIINPRPLIMDEILEQIFDKGKESLTSRQLTFLQRESTK
jgi:hypothetical protein